jgi:hypothetical protein
MALPLSLPKTSFEMTECDSCASWRCEVAFLAKLLLVVRSRLKSRASLKAENLILRQQVIVLSRKSHELMHVADSTVGLPKF